MSDEPSAPHDCRPRGFTRRGFLTGLGAGVVAAAHPARLPASPTGPEVLPKGVTTPITLSVNGGRHRLLVEPRWSLLFVLREKLGLTGTKAGCERGECGACTVLFGDVPRYACLALAPEAEGVEITTVEGLLEGEELSSLQRAFAEEDALQCGYCTPGQVMAAEGLLRATPEPDLAAVRRGMSGNLCRCGAYAHIFRAVQRAARTRSGKEGSR